MVRRVAKLALKNKNIFFFVPYNTFFLLIAYNATEVMSNSHVLSLDGKERAGCFALFVFLVSRDCCVALPHDAMGLSVVCD